MTTETPASPALPLPTVALPAPSLFEETPAPDAPTEAALPADIDQPVAGLDHFEHDYTRTNLGPALLFALIAGAGVLFTLLATPAPVRIAGAVLVAAFTVLAARAVRARAGDK